ncbi:MAG TPA: Rieske 2Fe-2S domain-containing protein [Thermoanaerobaculia bacterium]|nr:Rieske 2Fe-2S domain-containing protein [Thermoanaerobaculia bacterium]
MKKEIIDLIDQQEWLRTTADAVQKPVREALSQLGDTKDFLHGKWLGHPLHPAVTDIPLGAWTTALVLDALAMITDDDGVSAAADLAVGVGLIGAVMSAVTGLTDWTETDAKAKNVGAMHGLLNLTAAGLYTASLLERRRRSRDSGVALSMLGYAITSFSAYLGGHLVFGEQVGVDHTATQDRGKPKKYSAVMRDSELKERKPARVEVDGVAVLLVKIDSNVYALANTCTHAGGPLNEGELEGDSIRCPWHGSRFCLTDGALLGGPATFAERVFDVRVRDGQIEVRARD